MACGEIKKEESDATGTTGQVSGFGTARRKGSG